MPVPVIAVISAVSALLRYRGRVDSILSLHNAAAPLPFILPPVPPVDKRLGFLEYMWRFCESGDGQAALAAGGGTDAFARIVAAADENRNLPEDALNICYGIYFDCATLPDELLTKFGKSYIDEYRTAEARGGAGMRLAYFTVESARLSRNPVFTRLVLATVDTALEYLGENAGTFIANPRTRSLVESVLGEFALKQDFDDLSFERIYQSLLGAALFALLDNPDRVPNEPALKALFGALGDLRTKMAGPGGATQEKADEFIARLVSAEGFRDLVSGTLRNVAKDPSFLVSGDAAKAVAAATITAFADKFPAILDGDKTAVFGVVQAGIAAGADNVDGILKRTLGGQPLATAVAVAIAENIGATAAADNLFRDLATGQIFADIYSVALGAVAANPVALADAAGLGTFATDLVANLARTLSATPLQVTVNKETFRTLVSDSLGILAKHPELVARDNAFAAAVVAAAFQAGGTALADGADRADIHAIVDASLAAATDNLALAKVGDGLAPVLGAIGGALVSAGTAGLLTRVGRRDAVVAAIRVIAANPDVWKRLGDDGIAQPLAVAVIDGLATDPTGLLSGPRMVEAVRLSLAATARRGNAILTNAEAKPDAIRTLLHLGLEKAGTEIGRRIDGENLAAFLERVIAGFLAAPFALAAGDAQFEALVGQVLKTLETE